MTQSSLISQNTEATLNKLFWFFNFKQFEQQQKRSAALTGNWVTVVPRYLAEKRQRRKYMGPMLIFARRSCRGK